MKLDEVLPWGRNAAEYRAMFALTPADLGRRMLDCAGGPSSFTAEMTHDGCTVVSCDPLYRFTADEIAGRITETYSKITAMTTASQDNFLWDRYGSPEALAETRMQAMRRFLEDYNAGVESGRYIVGELPALPFASGAFDLALCSHFLFTYSEQFSLDFHIAAIEEMLRLATEVRIFPLLTAFAGNVSPHLRGVTDALQERGWHVEVVRVDYEFQKGGNAMLRAWAANRAGET